MSVRVLVQVLPAHRAQPGAVVAAEDLVRERKGNRVPGPRRQVEVVIRQVGRSELLFALGVVRLVLARGDRHLQHRIAEAAVAGTVQAGRETEVQDRAGARLRDRELGGHLVGHGEIALAAELERLELELDLVAILLPRTKLDLPQIETPHGVPGYRSLTSFRGTPWRSRTDGRASSRTRGRSPRVL